MRLNDLFAPLGDQQIPGGCSECDAFQTFVTLSPGVYSLTVHHDDDCLVLRAMSAGWN